MFVCFLLNSYWKRYLFCFSSLSKWWHTEYTRSSDNIVDLQHWWEKKNWLPASTTIFEKFTCSFHSGAGGVGERERTCDEWYYVLNCWDRLWVIYYTELRRLTVLLCKHFLWFHLFLSPPLNLSAVLPNLIIFFLKKYFVNLTSNINTLGFPLDSLSPLIVLPCVSYFKWYVIPGLSLWPFLSSVFTLLVISSSLRALK